MAKTIRFLMISAATALTALAILDQLLRDPAYRTWHGSVLGVPYDFRRPTPGKVLDALWTPERDHLMSPHVFGMGWMLNAGYLYKVIRNRVDGE
ncbi:hypothetical protein BH23CHL2_BH23CHL2_29480 [soil metagenome]